LFPRQPHPPPPTLVPYTTLFRSIEPPPARRSDDAIDTGANPNPVLPCKCSTGSSPERPSSNTSPSRANDTTGESITLCIQPPYRTYNESRLRCSRVISRATSSAV